MNLLKGSLKDAAEVARIYESAKGTEFCAWNEFYPTLEHAQNDALAGCLYILKDGDVTLGCASVEAVPEDSDLPQWRVRDEAFCEVARVAIAPEYRGKGYAKLLMSLLIEELKRDGVRSIHLLAAKMNPPAYRTYASLGFDFLGECHRYGHDYFVCEKLLDE